MTAKHALSSYNNQICFFVLHVLTHLSSKEGFSTKSRGLFLQEELVIKKIISLKMTLLDLVIF